MTFFLFFFALFAPQDKPQIDRWRGLILNETTTAQAIEKFGKPTEEKTNRLFVTGIDEKLLTEKRKEKNFRYLTWKKLNGVKLAMLTFQNDKLVVIYFWLEKDKEFAAASLSNSYGLPLEPKGSGLSEFFNGPIGGSPLSGRKHVDYPSVYYLIGQNDVAWISATIENASFKSIMLGNGDTSRTTGAFPGKVGAVQLISKTLENKDDVDVLK